MRRCLIKFFRGGIVNLHKVRISPEILDENLQVIRMRNFDAQKLRVIRPLSRHFQDERLIERWKEVNLVEAGSGAGELQPQEIFRRRIRGVAHRFIASGFQSLPPSVIEPDENRWATGSDFHQPIGEFAGPAWRRGIAAPEQFKHCPAADLIGGLQYLAVGVAVKSRFSQKDSNQIGGVGSGHLNESMKTVTLTGGDERRSLGLGWNLGISSIPGDRQEIS